MFLRVFLYKKLMQVKFYCVMSGQNENFVKNWAIDKRSVNCMLEIAFKCPESVISGLRSHQPIIAFIMQEYQPLLKFCRKVTLICSAIAHKVYLCLIVFITRASKILEPSEICPLFNLHFLFWNLHVHAFVFFKQTVNHSRDVFRTLMIEYFHKKSSIIDI